ncbi:DUF6233 domain-containing protein [Streptomyces sp. NPDC006172]
MPCVRQAAARHRQEALRRLVEGVPACGHCRPDSELGFLDG